MKLILVNETLNPINYLSGIISVPANSTFNVINVSHKIELAHDGKLRDDLIKNIITLSDGVNEFSSTDALEYLKEIELNSIASATTSSSAIANIGESLILNFDLASSVTVEVSGIWSGTLSVRASLDGVNFNTVVGLFPVPNGVATTTIITNGTWVIPVGGYRAIRVMSTAWTSGSANIIINSSLGANSNAGTNTANQGAPALYENAWPVTLGQKSDTNNTKTISSIDASPGSPWIGGWTQTRSIGFVRQLTVVASNVSSNLGGTFTFEYSEDGATSTISETRVITDFNTVRDFDLLNAGEYYRVKFEPSRVLAGGEFVFVTTTQRRQNDGAFVRLLNQELEEANAALPHHASFIKAFDPLTGKSTNIRPTPDDALRVSDDKAYRTPSGSNFIEGIRSDIEYDFGALLGSNSISKLLNFSLNGVVSHDSILGHAQFNTNASDGNVVFYMSEKASIYETGRGMRNDQTIFLSRLPIGTEKVEWGWCVKPISGNDFAHGIGYGVDVNGIYVFIKNNNTYTHKEYQSNWNRDKCDGGYKSLFKANGVPVALNVLYDNLYFSQFEWLGAYPPEFLIASPAATGPQPVHVIEYPNHHVFPTVPQAQMNLFVRATSNGTNLTVYSGSWRGGVFTNKNVITGKNPNDVHVDLRVQGIHDANSTTSPLNAGDTYRGTWYKWQDNYLTLFSALESDVSGTLYVDFSQAVNPTNGTDADISYTIPIPYDPGDLVVSRRNTPIQSTWVRHRYVNGPAAQTKLNLSAVFTTSDPGDIYVPAKELPNKDSLVGLKRSIGTIPNANHTGYQEIPVDSLTGNPTVTISNLRDDVLIEPLSNGLASQIIVGTTPIRIDSTQIANRRAIRFSNEGSARVAWGHSSGISFNSSSIRMKVNKTEHVLADNNLQFWVVAEDTGGVQTTLTRLAASASGTATNPSNVLTSNNVYANITANSQTITTTGYTAGTTNTLVSVKLGVEGNKQSGTLETVTFQDVITGSVLSSGTVSTSANVTAATSHLYIAAISRESNIDITFVTGLGLTWTQLLKQNSDDNNRAVDIWYAQGNPTGNGIVTASFSSTVSGAHISVSRYSNVDTTTPIQNFAGSNGANTTPTAGAVNGTNKGMSYMAAVIDNATTFTPAGGYTTVSAKFAADGLGTIRKPLTSTGADSPSATINANKHWAAISLTITPGPGQNPIVTLSYTLSGNPGVTSGNISFSSASDTNFTVDITPDRSWVYTDIANVNVIATGQSISAAAANIDTIYLEIVDTTGNTARISVWQGGKAVS